jgi:hypothetical protein
VQLLQGLSTPEVRNSGTKLAPANLIIAIGAQCSKTESTTEQAESFFFCSWATASLCGHARRPKPRFGSRVSPYVLLHARSVPLKCSVHVFGSCHSSCRGIFAAKIHTARLRRIDIQNGTNFYIESPVVLTDLGLLQNTNMAKSLRPGSASVLLLGPPICNIHVTS